jgi:hypothetical protein
MAVKRKPTHRRNPRLLTLNSRPPAVLVRPLTFKSGNNLRLVYDRPMVITGVPLTLRMDGYACTTVAVVGGTNSQQWIFTFSDAVTAYSCIMMQAADPAIRGIDGSYSEGLEDLLGRDFCRLKTVDYFHELLTVAFVWDQVVPDPVATPDSFILIAPNDDEYNGLTATKVGQNIIKVTFAQTFAGARYKVLNLNQFLPFPFPEAFDDPDIVWLTAQTGLINGVPYVP